MTFKRFWKRFWKSDNVYHSLRPLSYMSYISISPFRVNISADNKVQTCKYFYVASLIYYLLYLTANYRAGQVEFLHKFFGFIVITQIFVFALLKRGKLVSIIQNSIYVDDLFASLGVKLKYRRILWVTFLKSLGMTAINVLFIFVFTKIYLLIMHDIINGIAYFPPHVNTTIMVAKFMCLTYLVENRFRLVNEILQDILDAHEKNSLESSPIHLTSNVPSIIRQNPEFAIKQVSKIHSLLCKICDAIEDYFSLFLMLTITESFKFILFCSFTIVTGMMGGIDIRTVFWGVSIQIIFSIAFIFLIVGASTKAVNQSRASGIIVHDILNITENTELKDRLSRLSSQLLHHKVDFTAAGIFSLDYSLLLTIAGSVTCYLIILLQSTASDGVKQLQAANQTTSI